MAVDAARAYAPALPVRPRRRQARARGAPRLRLAGGVAWIAVVAVLLAGVVALNVAVLRLNLQLDEFGAESARLRAKNAELASRAATGASPVRIRAEAAAHGYRPVDATEITFIDLGRRAR